MGDALTQVKGQIVSEEQSTLVAHYALKSDVTKAHVLGVEIYAICGKAWVPSRDGSEYPICADCDEIYSELPD